MGVYKIKDIEILTGIKAHTIRIWEKRYGIPTPSRTETKIRSYSDDDLKELLNVAILNKNGMKISKIAELNNSDKLKNVDIIRSYDKVDIHHENLLLALMELDEHLFLTTLQSLFGQFGVIESFSKHLTRFLERIGILWLTGAIEPAQEHFISNLLRQKILALTDQLPLPEKNSPKILLFLPENEWHELSLLFYHYELRRRGLFSIYLGQNMPVDSIINSIEQQKPFGILANCVSSFGENHYQNLFKKIKSKSKDITIFAAGYQISSQKERYKDLIVALESPSDIEKILVAIG